MADNEFFEIPGATGDNGGSGEGQGASNPAPADKNDYMQSQLDKLGAAVQSLVDRDKKATQSNEVNELKRRISAAIGKKQREVDEAETALSEAYEDGDGGAIARAQRA